MYRTSDFKVTNQAGQAADVFWTGPKIIAADIITRFYYRCFIIVIFVIPMSFMGKFYKHSLLTCNKTVTSKYFMHNFMFFNEIMPVFVYTNNPVVND